MNIIKIAIAFALALGCGGVPDTSDLDARILRVVTAHMPDGTTRTTVKVGDVDTEWIPPDELAFPDEGGDYGVARQALTWPGLNYGAYSGGTAENGQCPAGGWSSPQYCSIPATKKFNWVSTLGTSGDAVAGVNLQQRWDAAMYYYTSLYLSSQYGQSHDFRTDVEDVPGSGFNGHVQLTFDTAADCLGDGTDLMCNASNIGSVFTSGGKRYRRQVKIADSFGYNAYNELYVNPFGLGDFLNLHVSGPDAQTLKNNYTRNAYLHEVGHAIGNAHNPGGNVTRNGCPQAACYTSAMVPYTNAETSARVGFVP